MLDIHLASHAENHIIIGVGGEGWGGGKGGRGGGEEGGEKP